jgi:hypothetical protein
VQTDNEEHIVQLDGHVEQTDPFAYLPLIHAVHTVAEVQAVQFVIVHAVQIVPLKYLPT